MKNTILYILCMLPILALGQKLGPAVINSGGYTTTIGDRAYGVSIGEVMGTTIRGSGITIKQGVLQNTDADILPVGDCRKNYGRVYYETCPEDNNVTYVFYELEDGTILDPYFDGISFANYDGQYVNFDYVDADFDTPCSQADQAVIVTCIEETLAPPDCSKNEGSIFFASCEGETFFFIETSDGDTLDPYYDEGVVFNERDGQLINFDYIDADFDTPCSIAKKAITIRCISEIIVDSNDNLQLNERLTVYPNPAQDNIVITLDDLAINAVNIIDINGTIIAQQRNKSEHQIEINIQNIPSGIYWVEAKSETNTHTKKLVILR